MIRRFFRWFLLGSTAPTPEPPRRRNPLFSTDLEWDVASQATAVYGNVVQRLAAAAPKLTASAATGMDAANGGLSTLKNLDVQNIGDALFAWYGSQGFIGHQLAGLLAQHWLIDKACAMPARDAVRNGFEVKLTGATEATPELLEAIKKANRKFRINYHMKEFVRFGRVFGIRVAIFKVKSSDPKFYERPFNIDGVTKGSYQGIVEVDPYWCQPELNMASVSDPSSPEFYEPTWWRINGVRYHKSHLRIFRTSQPADFLKPSYNYGGIPVPQQIMERVYGAERTANEGPQLAMTKRTLVWNTDVAAMLANQTKFAQHMNNFATLRDNYGVKINDTDDKMQQFDTSLTDVDAVTMTQYQLVAAAAGVPVTKLLGTSPKGFNATGEYDESSYHEHLEDVQENDLTPFLEHHLELVVRSIIEPDAGMAPGTFEAHVDWNPVDSPTGKEQADENKAKAETDNLLVTMGAIDGMDVRNRIRTERDSGYFGIQDEPETDDATQALEDATAELEALAGGEGGDPLDVAHKALIHHPLDKATAALQPEPLDAALAALTGG